MYCFKFILIMLRKRACHLVGIVKEAFHMKWELVEAIVLVGQAKP